MLNVVISAFFPCFLYVDRVLKYGTSKSHRQRYARRTPEAHTATAQAVNVSEKVTSVRVIYDHKLECVVDRKNSAMNNAPDV